MNRMLFPKSIAPPTTTMSHAVEVMPGSRMLFITGQIPLAIDGTCPTSFTEQAELCWHNIIEILKEAKMELKDIVKIQGFVVNPKDMPAYRAVRARVLGDHRPASTMIVISELGRPEWKVEIEAVAARAG
jgi:enamine deaminase RidA (YjgF/YER057c/UK114 family)